MRALRQERAATHNASGQDCNRRRLGRNIYLDPLAQGRHLLLVAHISVVAEDLQRQRASRFRRGQFQRFLGHLLRALGVDVY